MKSNLPLPHILFVEDNSNDIELMTIALSEQLIPCRISVVYDGQEALNFLLNKDNDLPDLVLLDLNLPKLTGHQVLEKLRQELRTINLPIIILTISQAQQDLIQSYNLGANAFIKKSLDPTEFKAALKNLDIYWLFKTA